ncbi:MAG: LysR family transcriptional regulator [Bacteroidota bacterium]
MEIRHLKLIKAVADYGTLTKAASKLFLSQSALSHQLKELESKLGGEVFYRIHKKMILSPVGEHLYAAADQVLDILQKSDAQVRQSLGGKGAFIRVSAQCYTFFNWLSSLLSSYRPQFPDVEIRIIPEATFTTFEWLEKGRLDVGIFHYKPAGNGISVFPLFEDELVLVTAPESPLAKKTYVKPSNLSDSHYITHLLAKGCISRTYQEVFVDHAVKPAQITEVQLTEVILEMVRSGLGVSIMARWSVESYLEKGYVKAIPIGKKGMHRTWYAATLKSRQRPEYIEAFIECLKELGP